MGARAIQGKTPVGRDQAGSRAGSIPKLGLKRLHVIVAIPVTLRLAEPDPVDDAGMVQLVRNNGIIRPQKCFKQACIRIETGCVENGVVHSQELRQASLKLLVNRLGSADEPYRRETVSPPVQALVGRADNLRMIRQPEVVVGAQVDHLSAIGHADVGSLRRGQHALVLVQALFPNCSESRAELPRNGFVRISHSSEG